MRTKVVSFFQEFSNKKKLWHDCRAKIAFFDANDLLVSSQSSVSNGSTGEYCVKKFRPKIGKKVHESCLVASISNTKLYRNLAVSQTMCFVPSQELISRTDSWKAPKRGTIAHQYFVSKACWGFLKLRLLPVFSLSYFQKSAQFCQHKMCTTIS